MPGLMLELEGRFLTTYLAYLMVRELFKLSLFKIYLFRERASRRKIGGGEDRGRGRWKISTRLPAKLGA